MEQTARINKYKYKCRQPEQFPWLKTCTKVQTVKCHSAGHQCGFNNNNYVALFTFQRAKPRVGFLRSLAAGPPLKKTRAIMTNGKSESLFFRLSSIMSAIEGRKGVSSLQFGDLTDKLLCLHQSNKKGEKQHEVLKKPTKKSIR